MVLRFWKRATAIVRTPEEILLVKHFFPKSFGLSGGRIKSGEKAADAVKRELFEETGLKAKSAKHLFDWNYPHQSYNIFLVKAKGKIKLNYELTAYDYLGNVKSDEIGKSCKLFLGETLMGKVFNSLVFRIFKPL